MSIVLESGSPHVVGLVRYGVSGLFEAYPVVPGPIRQSSVHGSLKRNSSCSGSAGTPQRICRKCGIGKTRSVPFTVARSP
jgi:hypothetical protein